MRSIRKKRRRRSVVEPEPVDDRGDRRGTHSGVSVKLGYTLSEAGPMEKGGLPPSRELAYRDEREKWTGRSRRQYVHCPGECAQVH